MNGLVLDAGALIAFERGDRRVAALVARTLEVRSELRIPAGVVGQVWRNGQKQVRLARLLASSAVTVEPLDDERARAAGQLCGIRRTSDVIDASVALCAKTYRFGLVTNDVADMRRLDPSLRILGV
jgi:predicted nucleic acid-binding protein